jgi:hypothetical protein
MPTGFRCLPEVFDKYFLICLSAWILSPRENGHRDAAAAGASLAAVDTVGAPMMKVQRATAQEPGA